MDLTIIEAIIGAVAIVTAALIPILLKGRKEKKDTSIEAPNAIKSADDEKPLGAQFIDSDMNEFFRRAKSELIDPFGDDNHSIFVVAAKNWVDKLQKELDEEESRIEDGMLKIQEKYEGKKDKELAEGITAFLSITSTVGRVKKREILKHLAYLLSLSGTIDDSAIAVKIKKALS